ncbi:phage tail protein [Listeria monocytogenes]|uniref:Phage tail protein n=1 Tax=Listeria monocytogenes TaxID=1639 RepID=A0A823DKJ0_LISMN|nr:phage tail protein [Listeria monocytogenes]EAD1012203.1 phage tail protein [Listeria monocytogenes]EAD1186110.1 phage tail protein [Listeria monocytogenes]EAF8898029.1 phage tail protein [Listeria monocytogenes]
MGNKASLKVTNMVDKSLLKMAQESEKLQKTAWKQGAKLIADRLLANTPVWDGTKYTGGKGSYMQKHAKDNVVFSYNNQTGETLIGYSADVAWRMHFVNMGTMKQNGQHFIERTITETEADALRLVEEEIKRGLGL